MKLKSLAAEREKVDKAMKQDCGHSNFEVCTYTLHTMLQEEIFLMCNSIEKGYADIILCCLIFLISQILCFYLMHFCCFLCVCVLEHTYMLTLIFFRLKIFIEMNVN